MKEVSSVIIPAEQGYLVAIRLFASALAAKMGFDIDTAEEIKLCTAEACMLLMNQPYSINTLEVGFYLDCEGMDVNITALGAFSVKESDDSTETGLGKDILEALTDRLEISSENGILKKASFSKTISER